MSAVRTVPAFTIVLAALAATGPAAVADRAPHRPRVVVPQTLRARFHGYGRDVPPPGEEPTIVARDAETWRTFWTDAGYDAADVPRVDFRRRTVVGVFSGGYDGCQGFRIRSASVGPAGAVVTWHPTEARGCLCTMAVWTGWRFATIPRTDGPVTFRRGPVLVSTCR